MAKVRKSTVTKRKATRKNSNSKRRARTPEYGRFVLPMFISMVLLVAIAFFGLMGYRAAIASTFFSVKSVEVRGTDRTLPEEVERIVLANTEKTGVWQADLSDIRARVEKLPFVKTASVSMVLPSAIRVNLVERVPVAVVRLRGGEMLVDTEGNTIAPPGKKDTDSLFVMIGWDEAKTQDALKDNLARLKAYDKLRDQWSDMGIAGRVKEVDLTDLKQLTAIVEDSGRRVPVMLAKDDPGRSLSTAIEAITERQGKLRSVNARGVSAVLEYLNLQDEK